LLARHGKITGYAYDDADRLTSVTDPASHARQQVQVTAAVQGN
jgi:YD repeat-containing protein